MDKRLIQIGYALLVPASLLFGVRALLLLLGKGDPIPGFALAIAGILSGLGMIALIVGFLGSRHFVQVTASVIIALTGHWIVRDLVHENLGGAMVYLGTGFAASVRVPWAAAMGVMAGLGALLRSHPTYSGFGYTLIAIGALGTAYALLKSSEK